VTAAARPAMVRMEHVRALHMCSRGARRWLRRYGLDWSDFVRQGLPAALLRASGDPQAIALADLAEDEHGR